MRVKIEKSTASGEITAPPSKSFSHRLLIAAALAPGVSTVSGISFCDDVVATVNCLRALGVKIETSGDSVTVYGKSPYDFSPDEALYCKESGSTLRFLIPIALISGKETVFTGEKTLMERPMNLYGELFSDCGITYLQKDGKITVKGPLSPGEYKIAANVSSQFISGLLFALSALDGDSVIKLTTAVESRPYIDMTIAALSEFGISIKWEDDYTLVIKESGKFEAKCVSVEGDYSAAAFPYALNLFGSNVKVWGLKENSIQADAVFLKHYDSLIRGIPVIHLSDSPDLGPILFAVAAAKFGGIFHGTKRLRIKESDRCAAMAMELTKFGASVSIYEDTVTVYPKDFHKPNVTLDGHGDHRIVMALSVLLTLVGGEVDGAEAVAKSYPDFFRDLKKLGISLSEIEN